MKKKVFENVLWVVAAYITILIAVTVFQRDLMYFPAVDKPLLSEAGIGGVEEINVTTPDGLPLSSWYIPSSKGKQIIIWFHGNALHFAYRLSRAMPYIEAGYGVVLPSYRGYAGNPGQPSEEGLYQDARAYIDAIKASGIAEENIILYGESLGSGVTVQMATEYPNIKALVLEAPYTSTVDIAQMRFFFLPVRLLMRDKFDSVSKIKDVKAPVIVIHGHKDRIIPFRYGKRLFDAASEPKTLLEFPEAGHNDLEENQASQRVLEIL